MRFLLGGYTADMAGAATGIGVLRAGEADAASAGGPLAFEGEAVRTGGSPSWLTWHPSLDVVYAALEGDGTVQAFRRTGATSLAPFGPAVAVGEAPCHIAVAPDAGSLLVSCWGDGRVVRVRVDAEGRPTTTIAAAAAARDPYTREGASSSASAVAAAVLGTGAAGHADEAQAQQRDLAAAARALREAAGEEFAHLVPQYDAPETEPVVAATPAPTMDAAGEAVAERVSHAHQSVFLPGGVVAATDMGFDLVRLWRGVDGSLRALRDVVLPRGSGPRHMVWHPSGHLYVVTELSREVYVLAPGADGAWRVVSGAQLVGTLAGDTAAEICLSRDGQFVYVGVRGSDTLAVLRVHGDGSTLTPVALAEAGVAGPRHHTVVLDTLLVAGQRSDEVAALTLDVRTGVPGRARARTAAPSPTCLVAMR
ncbi:beta-propeller fold lactonase family protein [Microbacterium sp. Sa4CUA7]|uniref:Beta-propeller fold lactonase family protein n=1 Tax=Microbacterium pullorum TaxID=2762236 RepID=A0ABR8S5R8_9MICO|nr:beta-propeller fold lactonase family protein [Microbacterium pullorum]MBD7958424.1 beta-propeller fold lactonase family protein [Microbacterium pullorum]